MGRLFTVTDLKTYLGVSRSKLYELIAAGLQPSLYIGVSPRWHEDAIIEWVAAQPTCRNGKQTAGGRR